MELKSGPETTMLSRSAVLFSVDGESAGDWFGYAVCGLSDVNDDGVPDFAVGAHQNENWGSRPAPQAPSGYVRVYSGIDGAVLYELHSSGSMQVDGSDDHFGFSLVSIQDMDGDGTRELVVGSYLFDADDGDGATVDENTGGAFIFSGRTGEQIELLAGASWGDRFGYSLASSADLDGDDREDLLIGVQKTDGQYENEGSFAVIASVTGERLLEVMGPGVEAHLGSSVCPVNDVSGDGLPDLAGGAFMYSGNEGRNPESGWVGLYSSEGGGLLQSWVGADHDRFGFSMAHLSDTRVSGVARLAVGAPQSGWISDFQGPGYVRVYSPGKADYLFILRGRELGDQFGYSLARMRDLDRDGMEDLIVGAPGAVSVSQESMTGRRGTVYIISGRGGAGLCAIQGLRANDQFGAAVADIGDIDGDGISDILVGAPENTIGQTRPGYAVVISGAYLSQGELALARLPH